MATTSDDETTFGLASPAIVTEMTFARAVLAAPLPVIVVFHAGSCEASRTLVPMLRRIAPAFIGRLLVAFVDVDDEALIADQYNVQAVPSLVVFQDGEPMMRLIGFAAEGLVQELFREVAGGRSGHTLWRPTEEAFEDTVIIPLLEGWGWLYTRQESCVLRAGRRSRRGRVDILVQSADPDCPLTLFENKRLILSQRDVQEAASQAHGYAEALQVPSFVVAAPSGMWVYALQAESLALKGAFSSLDVYRRPEGLRDLLLRLHTA